MEQNLEMARDTAAVAALTPRERQVFWMLLRGMRAREIAARMSISLSGVHYFVKRIYRKLRVHSKTELVLRYFSFRPPQTEPEEKV